MSHFPPTIILRHRRENLKKCSLKGLEEREDMLFLRYPSFKLPDLTPYFLLTLDITASIPWVSMADRERGIFLVDGSWRHVEKIIKILPSSLEKRTLPSHIKTSYPRRQWDCPLPEIGLASVEALYVAYLLLQRKSADLLDHYYWKRSFGERNGFTELY